jgi:diguanylate cyclase (GGDEF)-like protein
LTKTPPENTRIVTRPARADGAPPPRDDTHEILEMIGAALDDHAAWLQKWHRAVVCGLPPDREVVSRHGPQISRFGNWFDLNSKRELLNQPVFDQLWSAHVAVREQGRALALRAVDGERLPARDYDAFMAASEAFVATGRRILEAFQRALFDLDPLTGVHNRRGMMAELDRERQRAARTGKDLCLCLCDVDHFKDVNDRHGHLVGDSVLLAIAGRLIANLRPYDSIYRFGGEEFLLAFAETGPDQAAAIAERLRTAVCAKDVIVDTGVALPVTASFGLAMVEAGASPEATIQRADEALYHAKRQGRNRVAVAWSLPESADV